MNTVFETYQPRIISFETKLELDTWNIKVYTISKQNKFASQAILENSIAQLPKWLKEIEASNLPIYQQAFLIVHEAREGVWILLNWWTGGEMVQSKVFFSHFDRPDQIVDSPYKTSSLLCVWELEIFAHERKSWIDHILSKPEQPEYSKYELDTLNVQL